MEDLDDSLGFEGKQMVDENQPEEIKDYNDMDDRKRKKQEEILFYINKIFFFIIPNQLVQKTQKCFCLGRMDTL